MSRSQNLNNLKNQIAPYIRCAIVGAQGRLGRGAIFGSRVSGDVYILNGNETTLESEIDKNFFKVAAFVEKFMKQEIGGANKSADMFDCLVADILHALKYNSLSSESKLKHVFETYILNDADFKEAQTAFFKLESSGKLSQTLDESSVKNMKEVSRDGKFGELKNELNEIEERYISEGGGYTEEQISNMEKEIDEKKREAIAIQEEKKREAKEALERDPEKTKAVKAHFEELMKIAEANEKGTEAYEQAITEMRQFANENKDIIYAESRYKKAQEEIREIKKIHAKSQRFEADGNQMGA